MRKSIATVSVSGTLEDKLGAIARARFDGVEIFENDLIACPLPPEEIRRRAEDLGLTIELYQPFRDFEAMPPEDFARNLRRAERKFEVMERLGATTLLVCSNVSERAIDDDDLAAEHLHRLAERAHDHGVRVAYEALAWGRHVADYRRSYEMAAAAGHSHLGICLDSFHILSRGDDPAGIRDIPGEKIFFLQLADAPRLSMDVLQWSRHHRDFPGQGGFELPAFVEHVLAAGYQGPLSLEVFNDTFRQADSGHTAIDGMRSLLFLEESVRGRVAGAVAGRAPAACERIELFAPPEPADLPGYAFAEFAVDAASAGPMTTVLETLGFTPAGRHRSKAVTLWRQGDIRLVLNSDPGGTAGEGPLGEGPTLSAVGLRSADPARTAGRAAAYLAEPEPRRRGPGEADLPSVRGAGGTVFLFCPDGPDASVPSGTGGVSPPGTGGVSPPGTGAGLGWTGDFITGNGDGCGGGRPSGDGVSGEGGVLRDIDHVALPVPYEEFDEAALFLRSVLGLRPEERLELADPHGLVLSRAMTSPDGGVRMAINVPRTGGRPPASGGAAHGAASVQHVAFGCDDIFAAAARMRSRGAALLPISANYYEDLAARWELADDLITAMRELGILYDRTAAGEFFHFYTRMIGPRLFFEVVQRVGGYRGYGAANALIRMTALRSPSPVPLPAVRESHGS